MQIILRLWLVASTIWVGIAYWALRGRVDQGLVQPVPWLFILGVPVAGLILIEAIRWVLAGRR